LSFMFYFYMNGSGEYFLVMAHNDDQHFDLLIVLQRRLSHCIVYLYHRHL